MMTKLLVGTALMFTLAACQARDEGNGSTVISVDRNAVDEGLDQAGNALGAAGNEVREAADQAAPALENAAAKAGAAAERLGDKAENAADRARADLADGNQQR